MENNNKFEYETMLIHKERLIKVIEAKDILTDNGETIHIKPKALIKFNNDDNEFTTFTYPMSHIFPKAATIEGKNLTKDVPFEDADYLLLSYPKNTNWKNVKLTKKMGIDDFGNAKWENRDFLLTGLKEHFRSESKEIYDAIRTSKNKENDVAIS